MSNPRRVWLSLAGLLSLSALLQLSGMAPALRYSRDAIAAGEVWRLVSAHVVHLGISHWALNAVGAVLVTALVGSYLRPLGWACSWLTCALCVSAGLWWFSLGVVWYVGLSGVLHGLLVTGAVAALGHHREHLFAALVLLAVAGKLVWEQTVGGMPGTAALAGGPVVTDAHLYGAIGGLLAGTIALAAHGIERRIAGC